MAAPESPECGVLPADDAGRKGFFSRFRRASNGVDPEQRKGGKLMQGLRKVFPNRQQQQQQQLPPPDEGEEEDDVLCTDSNSSSVTPSCNVTVPMSDQSVSPPLPPPPPAKRRSKLASLFTRGSGGRTSLFSPTRAAAAAASRFAFKGTAPAPVLRCVDGPRVGEVLPGAVVAVLEIENSWMRLAEGGWVAMVSDAGHFAPHTLRDEEEGEGAGGGGADAECAESPSGTQGDAPSPEEVAAFTRRCTAFYDFYCPERRESLKGVIQRREHSRAALGLLWDQMRQRYGTWPPPGYQELLAFLSHPDFSHAFSCPDDIAAAAVTLLRDGYTSAVLAARGMSLEELRALGGPLPLELKKAFVAASAPPGGPPTPPSPSAASSCSTFASPGQRHTLHATPASITPLLADDPDAGAVLLGCESDDHFQAELGRYSGYRVVAVADVPCYSVGAALAALASHPEGVPVAVQVEPPPPYRGGALELSKCLSSTASEAVGQRWGRFRPGDRVACNTVQEGWVEGAEVEACLSEDPPYLYDVRMVASGAVLKGWKEDNLRPAAVVWSRDDASLLEELRQLSNPSEMQAEELARLTQQYDAFIEQGLRSMQVSSPSARSRPTRGQRNSSSASPGRGVFRGLGKRLAARRARRGSTTSDDPLILASVNTSNPMVRCLRRVALSYRPDNLTSDARGRAVQRIRFLGEAWVWVVDEEVAVPDPDGHPFDSPLQRAARADARRRRRRRRQNTAWSPTNAGSAAFPQACALSLEDASSSSSSTSDPESRSDTLFNHTFAQLVQKVDASLLRDCVNVPDADAYPRLRSLHLACKARLLEESRRLDDYEDRTHLTLSRLYPHTRSLMSLCEALPPSEPDDFTDPVPHRKPPLSAYPYLQALALGVGDGCPCLAAFCSDLPPRAVSEVVQLRRGHVTRRPQRGPSGNKERRDSLVHADTDSVGTGASSPYSMSRAHSGRASTKDSPRSVPLGRLSPSTATSPTSAGPNPRAVSALVQPKSHKTRTKPKVQTRS